MAKELQQREAERAERNKAQQLYQQAKWLQHQFLPIVSRYRGENPPHALLITGREGLGKSLLAESVVASILCFTPQEGRPCGACQSCLWLVGGFHPDLYKIDEEGEIKVDTIRKIHHFTQITAEAKGKIILIQNADRMNINAANSLLKVLEEPPARVYFILVSSEPEKLPITVRSRCQLHEVPSPDLEQILQFLEPYILEESDRIELAELSFYAPFKALEYLEQGYLQNRDQLLLSVTQLFRREGEMPKLINDLLKEQESLLFDLLFFLLNASFKPEMAQKLPRLAGIFNILSHFSPQHRLLQYEKLIEVERLRTTQTNLAWELEAWFTLFYR